MRFRSPSRSPRSRVSVALAVAIVAAVAPAAPSGADDGATATPVRHASIDVRVPHPGGVVAAFGSIWVQSARLHSIWRVSPGGDVLAKLHGVSTNPGTQRHATQTGYQTMGAGFGAIWSLDRGSVVRIDQATNRVAARIPVSSDNQILAVGEGAVWVTGNPAILRRIDPRTNTVTMWVHLTASPGSIAFGGGAVWTSRYSEAGGLDRIDPQTGTVETVWGWTSTDFMIGGYHRVWLTSGGADVAPLVPATNRVGHGVVLRGSNQPFTGMAAGLGRIWLNAPRLVALNPRNRHLVSFDGAGGPAAFRVAGVAVLGHRVWLAAPRGALIGVPVCWKIYCPA